MQAIVATIQLKPEFRDQFVDALVDNAKGSVKNELGCLRFDVVQDLEDSNRIHVYEVYRDQAAIDTHRQGPEFLKMHDIVKEHWFASKTVMHQCSTVFPTDSQWNE